MKGILISFFVVLFILTGMQTGFAQDDEARAASGLPTMIGRRGCTNPAVGSDASLSGSVVINGISETEKSPAISVSLMSNGVLVSRERLKNGGSFSFSCVPRYGVALIVEVDGLEIGNYPLGSLNPPPLSNRQEVILTWAQVGQVVKRQNEVISVRNSYERTAENQKAFDKATASLKEKKLENSVKLFKAIVEKDATDFVAWTELGNLYFLEEEFSEAETAYNKALTLKMDFGPALMNLGKLYINQKQPDRAIEVLTKAVESSPNSADANQYLGEAYLLGKKGSKAVGYLNRAIEIAPIEKAEIHLRLAALYNAAGAKDRAAAEYKTFLKKVPNHAEKEKLQKYISDNTPK